MMTTPLKALANFFNSDDSRKVSIRDFNTELKALTPADKLELVTGVLAVTGDTISADDMAKLNAAAGV